MFIWDSYAPATELRLRIATEPSERGQFCRFPANSAQVVSRPHNCLITCNYFLQIQDGITFSGPIKDQPR